MRGNRQIDLYLILGASCVLVLGLVRCSPVNMSVEKSNLNKSVGSVQGANGVDTSHELVVTKSARILDSAGNTAGYISSGSPQSQLILLSSDSADLANEFDSFQRAGRAEMKIRGTPNSASFVRLTFRGPITSDALEALNNSDIRLKHMSDDRWSLELSPDASDALRASLTELMRLVIVVKTGATN